MAERKKSSSVPSGRRTQARKRSGAGLNLIGSLIRKARLNRDPQWSQEELCAQLQHHGLDFTSATISKIESGQRAVYDYEVRAFCLALTLDANRILGVNIDGMEVLPE